MAKAESQMLPLGTEAPMFSLPDPDGEIFSLDGAAGSAAYLVMFICNHCPYVKHLREELARLSVDYAERSVMTYGINSNDAESHLHPQRGIPIIGSQWRYAGRISTVGCCQHTHNTPVFNGPTLGL